MDNGFSTDIGKAAFVFYTPGGFFGTPENATRTRHHQGDRYSQQHCRFHLTTPLNAKYNAVMLAASRVGDEYDKRVNQAWAARDVAFEKYYLARYGKKPYE